MAGDAAPLGVVVPTWNRPAAVGRCLAAVLREPGATRAIVVVDNGSRPAERDALLAATAGLAGVEVIALPVNRGFAAAVNVGLQAVFARGASAAVVVNDDAEVEAGALAALSDHARRDPAAGIVAPAVLDAESGHEVSRGERVRLPLVCLPRTWLRVRGDAVRPYAVSGVLGVAFLVTRACFERVGAFAEEFFAYYEEVEYWLRVRAAGLTIVVVPAARVRHAGFRGFAGGFSPLSAYLKARNLPLLLRRRRAGAGTRSIFMATYALLVAASLVLYAARGGRDVVGALVAGTVDGLRGRSGAPPAHLLLPAPPPPAEHAAARVVS